MLVVSVLAQSKAQIHIRKNQNGTVSEETREVPMKDGQTIQEILLEMGVLDEFGQLKEGQELEINIDKTGGADEDETLQFYYFQDTPGAPALPEFAPAGPMEARPFLGVMLRESNDNEPKGAYVTEVVEGSAAETAGIEAGDIITAVDKQKIEGVSDLIGYVQSRETGDKVNVQLQRDGKKKKVKAQLGQKEMGPPEYFGGPDDSAFPTPPGASNYNFRFDGDSITIFCPPKPNCVCPNDSMKICQPFSWNGEGMTIKETAFLGVTPIPTEEGLTEGVKVNIEHETAAEKMGLQDGDVIIEFNNTKVLSFDSLSELIAATTPGAVVTVKVLRDGKQKEVSGEIGKRSMSGYEDFRIFHDFKGMDEGGNYFYDYEFDMDVDDVQQHMEQLLQELDQQQMMLDSERDRIESELDKLRSEQNESINIKIQIAEITGEELQQVNKNASPKLEAQNNLAIDEISFYPNPNDGVLNLSFITTQKLPVKVVLYNSDGGIVYLEERSAFDGNYKKTIDISDEPNGTYFLQILQNEKSYSKKIIKGM